MIWSRRGEFRVVSANHKMVLDWVTLAGNYDECCGVMGDREFTPKLVIWHTNSATQRCDVRWMGCVDYQLWSEVGTMRMEDCPQLN